MNRNVPGFDEISCFDVSLGERLAAYDKFLFTKTPDTTKLYRGLIERLSAAGAGAKAPKVGARLPDFLLPDSDGKLRCLAELVADGPVVVSFNRGHWCSYCLLELHALAEIHSDVDRLGAQLVSIMPDRAAQTKQLRQRLKLPFQVLTDIDNGYALSCGLMISLDQGIRERYLSIGRDLADFQGNNTWFVPIPASFVVGHDRRILGRMVDPDFTHRMAPEDILSCLSNNG